MIPLKDDNPSSSRPIINYLLIAVNIIVFMHEISLPYKERSVFLLNHAFIPSMMFVYHDFFHSIVRMFESMFLHGGFLHIGGNMLFLWIFGDNVEDRLGHVNYLFFYLAGGFLSFLAQGVVNPTSEIPMIGASGAISAVIGAYAVFFPSARILTLVPIFIFITFIRIPAWLFIGFWFLMQYFNGMISIAANYTGGVAWFAHIGGFVFGFVVAKIILAREFR
ncbi:rhomboid family intramembrane serine protease [Hippea alviniae]|uniref:rhomboid family intramembrane serine protease n=1 Tax=Hippea alviniae TaxID=1279027 RepID=UPI0003B363E3|nr:rhomboid family intramembrane serine protease [Hippea alviniae]